MNFFKKQTCWSNIEFVWLKLCVGSAYLFIGTYYHDFLKDYYLPIIIVFSIAVVQTLFLWIKKMEPKSK